jgi:hypothetical protein
MNNENEHWLKLAVEKSIYLNSLGSQSKKDLPRTIRASPRKFLVPRKKTACRAACF